LQANINAGDPIFSRPDVTHADHGAPACGETGAIRPYLADVKPNRRSIRLPGYDYASAGWYFVTLICHKRKPLFGEVLEGEMLLNEAGKIAEKCWLEIPEHFPDVILHEYVVMPNHIHGIIELTALSEVRAENFLPLQYTKHEFGKMIPRSVSSIVKGFKIGVTKTMRKISPEVQVWHRNYHEHIIRNEESFRKISDYIRNNPAQWQEDEYFPVR
jgi:REP element-mobilizing transposase RayT